MSKMAALRSVHHRFNVIDKKKLKGCSTTLRMQLGARYHAHIGTYGRAFYFVPVIFYSEMS